jgi:hypothetical protein
MQQQFRESCFISGLINFGNIAAIGCNLELFCYISVDVLAKTGKPAFFRLLGTYTK